ncbi:MAG TPA: phage holin family protein [Candidatus Binatia bacterium]|jgi:uncharacterized membrane protein YqjE
MADDVSETGTVHEPGFFESLKAVMADFIALLQTRLELLATEFEEEKERLKRTVVLLAVSLFCLGVGVIVATIFVVAIFWDTHRLLALGGCALFYLLLAAILGLTARRTINRKPKFLSATLAELAKDRERMESRG